MGGKAPRQKGNRMERSCVLLARALGLTAERVPLSGAAGGSYVSDITIRVLGLLRRFECKWRGDGYKQIYKHLGTNDGLIIKADDKPMLMVQPYEDWLRMAVIASRNEELSRAA
jgi:Holliday junction resolvase